MAYTEEATYTKAPVPGAQVSDVAEELRQANTFDALIEGLIRAITKENDGNGIISGGAVSATTGLGVSVAALKALVAGQYCVSTGATALTLPDDEATIYIYALAGSAPNPDRDVTFEASLSATPSSDGIEIARCTTSGGAVTVINNASAGRPQWAWE